MKIIKTYREWRRIVEQDEIPYSPQPWHEIDNASAPEGPAGLTGDYDYSAVNSKDPTVDEVPKDKNWIANKVRRLLGSDNPAVLKSLKKRINTAIDENVNKKFNSSAEKPKIDPINIQSQIVATKNEVLKALSGVQTHEYTEILPIFPNNQDIEELADLIQPVLDKLANSEKPLHAYLIAGHGLYTWGSTMSETIRHVDALNTLIESYLLEMQLNKVMQGKEEAVKV